MSASQRLPKSSETSEVWRVGFHWLLALQLLSWPRPVESCLMSLGAQSGFRVSLTDLKRRCGEPLVALLAIARGDESGASRDRVDDRELLGHLGDDGLFCRAIEVDHFLWLGFRVRSRYAPHAEQADQQAQ